MKSDRSRKLARDAVLLSTLSSAGAFSQQAVTFSPPTNSICAATPRANVVRLEVPCGNPRKSNSVQGTIIDSNLVLTVLHAIDRSCLRQAEQSLPLVLRVGLRRYPDPEQFYNAAVAWADRDRDMMVLRLSPVNAGGTRPPPLSRTPTVVAANTVRSTSEYCAQVYRTSERASAAIPIVAASLFHSSSAQANRSFCLPSNRGLPVAYIDPRIRHSDSEDPLVFDRNQSIPVCVFDHEARPGFSGGPIFNRRGELVATGVLIATDQRFIAVEIPTLPALQQLQLSNLSPSNIGDGPNIAVEFDHSLASDQRTAPLSSYLSQSVSPEAAQASELLDEVLTVTHELSRDIAADPFPNSQVTSVRSSFESAIRTTEQTLSRLSQSCPDAQQLVQVWNILKPYLRLQAFNGSLQTIVSAITRLGIRPFSASAEVCPPTSNCIPYRFPGMPAAVIPQLTDAPVDNWSWWTPGGRGNPIAISPFEQLFIRAQLASNASLVVRMLQQPVRDADACEIANTILFSHAAGSAITSRCTSPLPPSSSLASDWLAIAPHRRITWSGLPSDLYVQAHMWRELVRRNWVSPEYLLAFPAGIRLGSVSSRLDLLCAISPDDELAELHDAISRSGVSFKERLLQLYSREAVAFSQLPLVFRGLSGVSCSPSSVYQELTSQAAANSVISDRSQHLVDNVFFRLNQTAASFESNSLPTNVGQLLLDRLRQMLQDLACPQPTSTPQVTPPQISNLSVQTNDAQAASTGDRYDADAAIDAHDASERQAD